eukprot:scaffold4622_cov368-Prasinococcus_capsulatus_cf.AAC.5
MAAAAQTGRATPPGRCRECTTSAGVGGIIIHCSPARRAQRIVTPASRVWPERRADALYLQGSARHSGRAQARRHDAGRAPPRRARSRGARRTRVLCVRRSSDDDHARAAPQLVAQRAARPGTGGLAPFTLPTGWDCPNTGEYQGKGGSCPYPADPPRAPAPRARRRPKRRPAAPIQAGERRPAAPIQAGERRRTCHRATRARRAAGVRAGAVRRRRSPARGVRCGPARCRPQWVGAASGVVQACAWRPYIGVPRASPAPLSVRRG